MKRLFTITCFFWATTFAFGQTFILQGKVYKNNQALPGVNISIKGTDQGQVSNFEGEFKFELPKGKYTLIFSYGGQKKRTITLTTDQTITVDMTDVHTQLGAVFLTAFRVETGSPVTYSNMSSQEINERNLGQSIPTLMRYMPNVVTTSDAGTGVGYTGMRVRGTGSRGINVTINGIPMNDAESQSTIWVDLGDFSNAVENLQLQRGVGTSSNGAGAFGASINVLTDKVTPEPSAEITNTYGSYNTHKHQIKFNTGFIDQHFAFTGNFSLLKSEGYRDRSASNLKSYFLQGVYKNENTLVKALAFGGREKTDQAYYGITAEQLEENRRFNPAGMYTDSAGSVHFYDNQTDNYEQDHLQLLWNQKYSTQWSSNLAFHYTYGAGYYESYHEDADLQAYGLPYFKHQGANITTSDLINQKWLSNHFYGTIFNLTYKNQKAQIIFGGGWNQYLGAHYGTVQYTKFAINKAPFGHYYNNNAVKTDFNAYLKTTVKITPELWVFGDAQWRHIKYEVSGPYEGQSFVVNDQFSFFNPKVGLTYRLHPHHQLYFSFSRAHREPNRGDYKSEMLNNPDPEYPKAEILNDYELGWRYQTKDFGFNANLYYMDYHNQLVLTGQIDSEGRFIRKNSGQSYRLGLELSAHIAITDKFEIRPNLAFSQNKNKHFKTLIQGDLKDFGQTPISFSPQIVGSNMLRYQPLDNLQISFLTKFVGEQYLSNIKAADSKLEAYWVNSLNVQYLWENPPFFKEIVFTGLVNNIFDEKYISNGYYSVASGPFYYPQAGINFLAGMSLKF